MHISRPYKTEQYWTETSGTGTQLAEVSVTETSTLYIFSMGFYIKVALQLP
jgi:hypothetical protein